MQAVEMIIFFIAAVAIAGMILIFVGTINPKEIYGTIERLMFPKQIDANVMFTVKKGEFVGKIGACWQQCGFGAKNLNCGSFYINTEGIAETEQQLTMEYLTGMFSKYNYCSDCNATMQPDPIDLPAIVILECTTQGLVIKQ